MTSIAIDTSAIIEVLTKGPQAAAIRSKLAAADLVIATPVTRVEAALVLIGRFGWQRSEFELAWNTLGLEEVPLDTPIGTLAVTAFDSFGKGRASAALNFGDCFSYALAAAHRLPLLFIGQDFSSTDVEVA